MRLDRYFFGPVFALGSVILVWVGVCLLASAIDGYEVTCAVVALAMACFGFWQAADCLKSAR